MNRRLINALIAAFLFGLLVITGCSPGSALPDSQRLVGQARINMRSGNTYMNYEEYDLALERYLEVIEESPEYIEALKRVGDIYFFYAEQQPAKAVDFYNDAYKHYVKAIEAYEDIKDKGHFPEIKEVVDDAHLKRRAAWARLFTAGQEKLGEQNTQEALELFYNISELTPDSTNVYVMIATIHQQLNDFQTAAEYFKRIADIDRQDTVSRQNLALHYINQQDFDEAIRWYQEAADIEPENPDFYYYMGLVYRDMDDKGEEAIESFEKAFEIDDQFIDAIVNAGFTAFEIQDFGKAAESFKKVLELEPEDEEVLLFLLTALQQEENYQDMLEYGEKWYGFNNESIDAVQFVIIAAHRLGDLDKQMHYQEILEELEED